jgi:hypothetical protein
MMTNKTEVGAVSLITLDPGVYVHTSRIAAPRIQSNKPMDFRYMKKDDGRLILQGAYAWSQGFTDGGVEWKDIPVVDENGIGITNHMAPEASRPSTAPRTERSAGPSGADGKGSDAG